MRNYGGISPPGLTIMGDIYDKHTKQCKIY